MPLPPEGRGYVQVRDDSEWVSEYDYEGRVASLTLASVDGTLGHRSSSVTLSEPLSAPNGTFSVFGTSGDGTPVVTKIVAALEDDGALLDPRPDFRDEFVGSYTLVTLQACRGTLGIRPLDGRAAGLALRWPAPIVSSRQRLVAPPEADRRLVTRRVPARLFTGVRCDGVWPDLTPTRAKGASAVS